MEVYDIIKTKHLILHRRYVSMHFDYDEMECKVCGHIGLVPNGGYDTMCPECGYEDSLAEEPNEELDDEDDEDE